MKYALGCVGFVLQADAFMMPGSSPAPPAPSRRTRSSLWHLKSSAAAAASTPPPVMAKSEVTASAADSAPSPSAGAARRATWVPPFYPPVATAAGSAAPRDNAGAGSAASSRPHDTPTFQYRQTFYDMSTATAGTTASPPAASEAPATPGKAEAEAVAASPKKQEPAAASVAESVPSPSAGAARRATWVPPFIPPVAPAAGNTAPGANAGAGSAASPRPHDAPTFQYRQTFYDVSTATAGTTASPPAASEAPATPGKAEAEVVAASPKKQEPAAASVAESVPSPSAGAARRATWVPPFIPPVAPAAGNTAPGANAGAGSAASSRPHDAPTFQYRQTFYDMSVATAGTTASPPAASEAPATPGKAEAEAVAAAAAKTPPPPPPAAPTKTARVAASTTGTSSASRPEKQAQAAAAKIPTPPPAAKASSAPARPPPVAFEPAPTLITDSPMYEDVKITISRAKETLAPFTKKIQDNVAEGNVGERGEEWAVAQALILLFVAMGSVPLVGGLFTFLAGPGLVAGGVGVIAAGLKGLGKSLSPWPAPVQDNELNTDGIYGMMRHPMYTGLVMFCLGFGVLTDSPLRMLLAVLLALVLDKKADKEEKMLVKLHGEAYEDYREMVAKFVPRFY